MLEFSAVQPHDDISGHLNQHVKHLSQSSLYAIPTSVPSPIPEQVLVNRLFIHEYMLRKLWRIIVQEVSEGINNLGYCCSEESILFREVFGKTDERFQGPCLWAQNKSTFIDRSTQHLLHTLNEGTTRGERTAELLEFVSLVCSSWNAPSASPSCGIARSQVLWSDGIISEVYMRQRANR